MPAKGPYGNPRGRSSGNRVRWCCTCGEVDPDGAEVCPVSDVWMKSMGGKGLRHLIAYGVHARALEAWERAREWRAKSNLSRRTPPNVA